MPLIAALLAGCGSQEWETRGDLRFAAGLEAKGSEISGTLELKNAGDQTVYITMNTCKLLLRVYQGDQLVWDQFEHRDCRPVPGPLLIIPPGASTDFRTSPAQPDEILGAQLPNGEYQFTVYLLYEDPSWEFAAGELELSR